AGALDCYVVGVVAVAHDRETLDRERAGTRVGDEDVDIVELVELVEDVLLVLSQVDRETTGVDRELAAVSREQADGRKCAQIDACGAAVLGDPVGGAVLQAGRQEELGGDQQCHQCDAQADRYSTHTIASPASPEERWPSG